MKIQVGEIYMDKVTNKPFLYPNKSRKYLLPCLKDYGEVFMNKLDNVFKIAVGVGDIVVSNRGIKYEKHIFILLNSVFLPKFFIDFIDWIREQPMYADDYVFHNIQKSESHMVVLKIPEKFYSSMEKFKLGEYSKMYNTKELNQYFRNNPDIYKTFIKDHNYKLVFVDKMNKEFNSQVESKEYNGELDFPPKPSNEIFNYHLKKK